MGIELNPIDSPLSLRPEAEIIARFFGKKVAVLFGGDSAEREVSLMSGQGVLQALRSKGIDAHGFDPSCEPLERLKAEGFAACFIALHGRNGEDGCVQGLLELLRIPYTGSGVMASAIAMDKVMTKRLWLVDGLPTPPYAIAQQYEDLEALKLHPGFPMILKPPHEGSTIGITRAETLADLEAAFEAALQYEGIVLAERLIHGRELTVAVLGKGKSAFALPVVEIRAPGGNYDFHHKYISEDTRYLCPAPLASDLAARIQSLAVQAFCSVGCEGWGRVDFMLSEQDEPWLLEVNTAPGMTSHSLVPIAAAAVGLDYPGLCLQLLGEAKLKTNGTLA